MDEIFAHVEKGIELLKEDNPKSALRILEMIRYRLAVETLRRTDADMRSEHFMHIVKVLAETAPKD